MKRAGELMAELGFREDAPESLKKALMEGMLKKLTATEAALVEAKIQAAKTAAVLQAPQPEQLTLFGDEMPIRPKIKSQQTG